MKIRVVPGCIGVKSIGLMVDQPDCKVLDIECRAKWPEISAFAGAYEPEPSESIILTGGERTLNMLT